jgi:hypothetical protein
LKAGLRAPAILILGRGNGYIGHFGMDAEIQHPWKAKLQSPAMPNQTPRSQLDTVHGLDSGIPARMTGA